MSTALIANNIKDMSSSLKFSNSKLINAQQKPSREQFIMSAMQALLSNPQIQLDAEVVADLAVVFGEATWKKANEEKQAA